MLPWGATGGTGLKKTKKGATEGGGDGVAAGDDRAVHKFSAEI